MKSHPSLLVGLLYGASLLLSGATALAQTGGGEAFTATGESCDQVSWSKASVEQYPQIASACQGVVQRGGKYYVMFKGRVTGVIDRGRQIAVAFRGGDRLTLTPPENFRIRMDGRDIGAGDLQRDDELTFYIPQDQLSPSLLAGDSAGTASTAEERGAASATARAGTGTNADSGAAAAALPAGDAPAETAEQAAGDQVAAQTAAAATPDSPVSTPTAAVRPASVSGTSNIGILWLVFMLLAATAIWAGYHMLGTVSRRSSARPSV